jgi:FlaA1/EpsC-like NDP-sugar epimerase
VVGAYLIRFNFSIPAEFIPGFQLGLIVVIALQGGLLRAFGLYRSLWLFASLPDLLCIARAVVVAAVLTPLVVVVAVRYAPRCRGWCICCSRCCWRSTWAAVGPSTAPGRSSGSTAGCAPRGSRCWCWGRRGGRQSGARPVPLSRVAGGRGARRYAGAPGREIHGCEVLGGIAELDWLAEEMKVGHAIIAMPSEGHEKRRVAASACVRAGVKA